VKTKTNMGNAFNSKKYLEKVLEEIKERSEKTKGKLYVEIN
jgi:uncharacterized protein (UPF0371 family)